jgi:hypothetical protein
VRDMRIFFVDQADIAQHITGEGENCRKAIRHSIVQPPHSAPQAFGSQNGIEFLRETSHEAFSLTTHTELEYAETMHILRTGYSKQKPTRRSLYCI